MRLSLLKESPTLVILGLCIAAGLVRAKRYRRSSLLLVTGIGLIAANSLASRFEEVIAYWFAGIHGFPDAYGYREELITVGYFQKSLMLIGIVVVTVAVYIDRPCLSGEGANAIPSPVVDPEPASSKRDS